MHKENLENLLGVSVKSVQSIGGGCVGDSYHAVDSNGINYFIKTYRKRGMVDSELFGLKVLSSIGVIKVPAVIASNEYLLILEYIESGKPQSSFYEIFGHQLAELHNNTNSSFGLSCNTYLGTYKQDNKATLSWCDFYVHQRLEPQFQQVLQKGLIHHKKVESLLKVVENTISDTTIRPSLIHGDLWSGNFMIGPNGEPVIFDPAISYSHWELELAMTKLFGGFSPQFYQAYHEIHKKTPGYNEREDMYILYHLLNHLNLFGNSYMHQVNHIINKYI